MKQLATIASTGLVVLLYCHLCISPACADTIYAVTTTGIEEFNSNGGTGTVFSAGGWGVLAVNASGTLYAAGPDNTIYKFDSSGDPSLFADSGVDSPGGLAFDASGNLYIANFNNTIEELAPNGTGSVFSAVGGLDFRSGSAFDTNGYLYVAYYNNAILKLNPDGTGSVFAASGLSNPMALAFDGNSNLYVANHGDADILKINPEGDVSIFASGLGNVVALAIEQIPEPSSLPLTALTIVSLSAFLKRRRRP
ncbi:MAG TPA: NHL repeat-containing protein [Verrucomicrobiae bacterium]|nr:NHL repeat-containing protein [Verrucomicrobiae bacterium]